MRSVRPVHMLVQELSSPGNVHQAISFEMTSVALGN